MVEHEVAHDRCFDCDEARSEERKTQMTMEQNQEPLIDPDSAEPHDGEA